MILKTYRFLNHNELYDITPPYNKHWSRPYEYELIINRIKQYREENPDIKNMVVHNTACGTTGVRLSDIFFAFKKHLTLYNWDVIHSDIKECEDIIKYDITQPFMYKEFFDVVINISVIEHLPETHQLVALQNLYEQVKPGGLLLVTLDFPTVNLKIIDEFTKAHIAPFNPNILLTPRTSMCPEINDDLKIVYLEIEKEKCT